MVDLVRSTIGPTIRLITDIADELPPAKAEANQVEMALLNLAVNARDAMPDGGDLKIALTKCSVTEADGSTLTPGDYVCLQVIDSGIGMDPDTLRRAVEPFFSTKGIGKGTGLGLSMVHGLAAQLGGELKIDSTPGQGTSITLRLPASRDPLGHQQEAAGKAIPAPAARGRVLLVDDEDLVRATTADMLSELGWTVVEASDAPSALQKMATDSAPDLLITDHLMPGMSGAELAQQVRAGNAAMPILIVSGYAESDGIAPDLPRLNKPFRKDELAATINALFESTKR
jgi:CheY-like chemotaxis protein